MNTNIQNLPNTFSDQNNKLEAFLKQNQDNLNNISNGLKDLHDNLVSFRNEIDNSLKQVEMDMNNQPLLAKWLIGSNNKLKQEQLSQQRIILVDSAKKFDDNISQILDSIKQYLDEFNTGSQQFILDFKNTENQVKSMIQDTQSLQNQAPNSPVQALQQTIEQIIAALNSAQQGLEQSKVLNEINNNLNNIIQ